MRAGQVFHWPPGHTVFTDEGFESIQVSPQEEMQRTLDHVQARLDLERDSGS